DYERLDRFGSIFRKMIEANSFSFDEESMAILERIYDPGSELGQPDLIVDGQVAWHSHSLIAADANDPRVSYSAAATMLEGPYDINSFQRIGDSLHIELNGGVEWAGLWLTAGVNVSDRLSPDYSMYDKLVLELKGDVGGEKLYVNMEDMNDPMDGTSTRYELQLSDQWQIYEIDLQEFETADLTILSVPLGFVFLEEPVAFSIRSARFVKSE
ncbi:MAG: hypothetical protein ACO2ZA_08150, partial [Litorivicinaceae bacterium]